MLLHLLQLLQESLPILALAFIVMFSCWAAIVSLKLKDLEPIRKEASTIIRMIKDIHSYVMKQDHRSFISSKSPLSLTDEGKKLSERMNAQEIVQQYADKIKHEDMNAYQIQEECLRFSGEDLLDKLKESPNQFKKMSDIAYEEGVKIEELLHIIGILLRDEILKEHNYSHTEPDDRETKAKKKKEG